MPVVIRVERYKIYRVSTPRAEFSAAESGGFVYGKWIRQEAIPAYVELGTEEEYELSPKDNPNTEYRLFRDCTINIAETEEAVDKGDFDAIMTGATVIIYC